MSGPSSFDDPRVPLTENAVRWQGLRTMTSLRSTCKRESETLVRVTRPPTANGPTLLRVYALAGHVERSETKCVYPEDEQHFRRAAVYAHGLKWAMRPIQRQY